jgi:hypothetical protein
MNRRRGYQPGDSAWIANGGHVAGKRQGLITLAGARRVGFSAPAIYRGLLPVVRKSPAPISNTDLRDVDEPKQKCTMSPLLVRLLSERRQ